MKIISATLVQQRHGADIVSLRTDLPEACHPYKESLCLEFRCAKGSGLRYLMTHFPDVVIEHIAHEAADAVLAFSRCVDCGSTECEGDCLDALEREANSE